jgi:hypothetical protein
LSEEQFQFVHFAASNCEDEIVETWLFCWFPGWNYQAAFLVLCSKKYS